MKLSIEVKRKAHCHIQIPTNEIQSILYVIHGYGQLAEEFLKEFIDLKDSSILVVAPEAISKFYNKERKTVASWMTAHERLDEINNYCNYLDLLEQSIHSKFGALPQSVLGFSQGVSTALRWVYSSKNIFNSLFLVAGSIPPELNPTIKLKNTRVNFYHGIEDRLMTSTSALTQVELLTKLGFNVGNHDFDGSHEIPSIAIEDIKLIS